MSDMDILGQLEEENNIVLRKLTKEELEDRKNPYRGHFCDEAGAVIGL
ncbi:MAG: hypothetical protein GY754_13685 [bacterium]|nr:hypothetical protein [bacterium]